MIETTTNDGVHEIRLARPPANALNPEMVRALAGAITDAPDEGARGLLIRGSEGMFSAGLDLPQLLALDREAITSFWNDFVAMMRALAESPIPVAAAITGHAPAGGAVIALCCDYRVMAEGRYRIGLNEVRVGLPLPVILHNALTHVVGARQAALLGGEGRLLEPDAALRVGFVDELAPAEAVAPAARAWLDAVLALPRTAYAETRRQARAPLREALAEAGTARAIGAIAESWFSDETQTCLQRVVDDLKARKA